MSDNRFGDEYERAAGGVEFDEQNSEPASSSGSKPDHGALFDDLEQMLPEGVRQQVVSYPLAAIAVGVGIGIFLGMKKGNELITAGSSMIAAAATANLSQVLGKQSAEE